ncbi:MAG: AAA family ATPase [Methanosarcinales archaeon]|nr:AAA family ATPase [Methanosarcinales archaeon]
MIITISGPPGSGTTTLARFLSHEMGLRWVNSGEIFRKIASDKGVSVNELNRMAEKGPEIDYLIDDAQRAMARDGGGIFEGRLSGHLLEADLKIFLKTDLRVRAERISKREGKLFDDAFREARAREESEGLRYEKYYNINIDDLSIYNLVIDSGKWNEKGTQAIALAGVMALKE